MGALLGDFSGYSTDKDMNKGLIFFLAVMALYAFFILRGAVRAVRARVEKMNVKKYAKAQAIPRVKRNPYKKPRIDADAVLDFIEAKLKRLSGEDPIMSTRINRGSDRFFEEGAAATEAGGHEFGGFQDLWARRDKTATDKERDASR